jgi:hypothetical protein
MPVVYRSNTNLNEGFTRTEQSVVVLSVTMTNGMPIEDFNAHAAEECA